MGTVHHRSPEYGCGGELAFPTFPQYQESRFNSALHKMKKRKSEVHFYEHNQKGFYQEVYEDLLAMQEQAFDEPTYQDALFVARIMMHRVLLASLVS